MPSGVYKRKPRNLSKAGQEQPDMINQKFRRLIVLNYDKKVSKQKGRDYYLCRCNCGVEKIICGNNLRTEHVKSCGCLNQENLKKRNQVSENSRTYYHGLCTERNRFRKIVNERDKVCQRCGKTQEQNGRVLDAHHLDGNEYNNNPKNGALLCHKCNMIIAAKGNKWRHENGRVNYNKR